MIRYNMLMIFFLLSVNFAFSQKKQGVENDKKGKREQLNREDRQSTLISDGNLVMGAPTSKSIIASLISEGGSQAYIEYSESSGTYSRKTPVYKIQSSRPIEIVVDGLEPGKRYFYRLRLKSPGSNTFASSSESWFSTKKRADQVFSFGVQGDSHPERSGKMFNPVLYRQTLDSVSVYKPDFYFMMGDDFNIDRLLSNQELSREKVENVYRNQRSYLGSIGRNPPLFLVNGNHEQAARYLLDDTDQNAAVLAGNARKKYFPLPDPEGIYSGDQDTVKYIGLLKDYYAFEWGNALFVVIDPYWHSEVAVDNQPGIEGKRGKRDLWNITIGDEQYLWLKKTLEGSKAKFKFVFSHHVLGTGRGGIERAGSYEWGGKDPSGAFGFKDKRPNWELPIHQLMAKNRVTIFFQGHDHIFARQELDGVVYQSVPNPADDTYTAFNKEAYKSGHILPNSGFLNITVSDKEVTVSYIRSYLSGAPQTDDITKMYRYIIR